MRRLLLPLLGLVGLVGLAAPPALAEEGSGCAKFKWPVAREVTAFGQPDLPDLASGQPLPGVGSAVSLKLQPQADVAFAHPPGRKPKVDHARAVVTSLSVPEAGTYQVTLSEEAWIDVLQGGKEVRSSGFSGQPDCPGVRKSVKFPLKAEPATIQISGASSERVKVDVLKEE